MKIKMHFGLGKTLIIIAVILAAIAIIGVDIYMLTTLEQTLDKTVPIVASLSLVAAASIIVMCSLMLFNSYYCFALEKYVVVLGMFKDTINYDRIVSVKQNALTKEVYLMVEGQSQVDGVKSYHINVHEADISRYLEALRDKKPDIVIEMFTPENNDKNAQK